MIRKFFDPSVSEPAAAPSIAALMAKHGVNNTSDNPVAMPVSISEPKTEPTPVEDKTVATTTEPSKAEPASPETPSQVEPTHEPVKPAEPQRQEPVKPVTLQEVLRQHQPEAIFKELGYDDQLVNFVNGLKEIDPKMVAFLNTWKSGGDIQSYLKEMSTDYSEMPAEEVMRHQLRQEYPNASEKQLDILYRKEVAEKYNLLSDDETELEEGRLLLEAKADKYRQDFATKQQDFLLPKAPEPKPVAPSQEELQRQKDFEAYQSTVSNHELTKNIIASKQFSLGEGDEKFNYPVNPNELTDLLFDSEKWASTLYSEDGTPKVEHQLLVAAVAKYGMQFLNEYANHYKSLGRKAVIDPLENPSPVTPATPPSSQSAPKNPAEAMARMGQYNQGGY